VRYAGALPNILFNQSVPSYTTTDVRFAWNSSPQVQWSVTGRNLLTSGHLEFVSEMSDVANTLISPSIAFGLRYHVQLFSGYGDSLTDYNHKRTALRVGLSLVDW
jgi:hypothetical protein